ncbi:MAG: tetratricopeptide repeat protein [Candidatus Krumholzibacteriia bacterium]
MRNVIAACLLVLVTAPSQGTPSVPGAKGAPQDSVAARLRIFQVESLRQIPQGERAQAFGQYVLAVRAALEAGHHGRATLLADRACNFWKRYRRPLLHLAAAQLGSNLWGPSISSARQAAEARDDDMPPPRRDDESDAAPAYWEGVALYATQRYDEALPRLRAAVEAAPDWAEAARALGEAAFVAGLSQEAALAYAAAFRLDPRVGSARDLSYYAETKATDGDLESAIAALQEALRRSPYEPGLHANLAHLLQREDNLTDAYYHYTLELLVHGYDGSFAKKALAAAGSILAKVGNQENHPNRHELLLISSGMEDLQEGDAHRAVHTLEHAARISRTPTAVPRFLLAQALLRGGNAQAAREQIEQLLDFEPDFVPALVLLAEALRALGERQEAQTTVERAYDLFPAYWMLRPENIRG